MFLQTVESSFDHTVEFFLTKPEKFLLNVRKWSSKHFLFSEKNLFSPKTFLWTRRIFFDKIGKFLAQFPKTWAKHFFSKKVFFGENFPLETYNALLTNPSKKLRQRAKNLRSMSAIDQKQYKVFNFRKCLPLNCSSGRVEFCLDKPAEIFFDKNRKFFGPCGKC